MAPHSTEPPLILVKSGRYGSDLGGFYGAQYFEIWNVGFVKTGDLAPVPIPAAAWLFGSGLLGLIGISRRRLGNRFSGINHGPSDMSMMACAVPRLGDDERGARRHWPNP